MEEKIKKFWIIYDKYIQTEEKNLMPKLSDLLAQIENKDRRTQLLRPEKGWNNILAWQVLRNQSFIFNPNPFFLNQGEIIAWSPHWDRDVFLTRIPFTENVSGHILKPGFKLDFEDQEEKNISDYEWDQIVRTNGITDERGLYLPLYEFSTIIRLADNQIEQAKEKVVDYLNKEKGYGC